MHRQVGNSIDFYNIVFTPEAQSKYNTYEQVFGENGETGSYASIRQLINSGIPPYKLVIAETGSTGLAGGVEARDLGEWTKRAYDSMGWYSGVALWELSSDPQG